MSRLVSAAERLRTQMHRWGAAVLVALAVAGCAQERIRNESQAALAAGDYETAVRTLEAGAKEHPDSSLLRSGLVQARLEAQTRLFAEAASLRSAGKLDDARKLLERAAALDPQNTRVRALVDELAVEERQAAALAEAQALIDKKRPDAALRLVEQGLKDNPRHAGLRALQRRLEAEARQATVRAAQVGLAETRPISLDFRDASLRTVLDVVSRNSGVNFIFDRDLRPDTRVTVFLRQARVEDAIDLIIGTNQLAKKVIDPQTIVVYPNTPDKRREYQEQVVRVFYLANAEARGAATFLRSMANIREPFVDERTNMLSLRDSQENIQLAERLLALYDANEPEVLLEVEVMEISSTRLTELGVKFPTSFSLTPLDPSGGTDLTLGNVRGLNRDRIGLGVSDILVNLRREVGDYTTLANPRIRARNKEKAKVLIGDKIPIITTTTGTGGFVSDSISYIDVGLKLEVEPTVYPDDEVAIRIGLEVSSLGTATKTSSGALAYQIGTRNANTLLRLRDGETQLLAGLISRDESSSASRVPGLGDFPVLGRLFSSQLDNGKRSELVLAITPRVLRNVRVPDASEAELWVGTEALPRLRPVSFPASAVAPAPAMPGEGKPGPTAGAEPAPPAITLAWQGPKEVAVGDSFELALDIDSGVPLRGMPLSLRFDPKRLQWLQAREGEFFRLGGAPTSYSEEAAPEGGRARIGVLRSQATGASGKGTIVTLRFKALTAGEAEVVLEPTKPLALQPDVPQPAPPGPFKLQVR